MNSTLSVIDNTILGAHLSVSGATELNGNVLMNSSLSVLGNTSLNGNLYVSSNLVVDELVVLNSNVIVYGHVQMDSFLSVNEYVKTTNIYASNIQTSNIAILGNYVVQGNLEVLGDLTIDGTSFPLIPGSDDVTKVLAVNDNNHYELMTLFRQNKTCEFKSLFGVFETGTELEVVSGLFDFGVPKNWLSGWTGRLFDGVDSTDGVGVLAPDGSNVDMSTLELMEDLTTSNMDFKDFINVSMYKTNGDRLNKIAGIVVNDYVSPNYYFFLGTVDPNHDFFKYKFKMDFEEFYSNLPNMNYGGNYGYRVVLDSVRVPNRSLHTQGTNMFVVEFINTYDGAANYNDSSTRFNKSLDVSARKNTYYITDPSTGDITLKDDGLIGLYPHITYRRWRNSSKPIFYEKKYESDIGWGTDTPTLNDIYSRHHVNSNLKILYKLTYNFIRNGLTETDSWDETTWDTHYRNNVANVSGHNLLIHSNVNSNGYFIENNINSITFNSSAFPDVLFP
jgi:cytoskeletal protein CcmA (bactofilin family)